MSTPEPTAALIPTSGMPARGSRRQLDERVGIICLEWWAELTDFDLKKLEEGSRPQRAALAELRRLGTVEGPAGDEIDVSAALGQYGFPAYLTLHRRLRGLLTAWKGALHINHFVARPDFDATVAVVAATLARVREHKKGEVAKLLGAKKSRDDAALMAEARFKRLIRTSTAPDLRDQGRRIVMLLGRAVPVDDLGVSLLLWTVDPYAKRRWSFAYYAAEDITADKPDEADGADASSAPASA